MKSRGNAVDYICLYVKTSYLYYLVYEHSLLIFISFSLEPQFDQSV